MVRRDDRYQAAPRRAWSRWLLVMLLVPALVACGAQQTGAGPAGERVVAVTTMSILADMVKNVGGDRVEAQNIIPVGAGPEDYQPTPQDVQIIASADIVFYNGHGLEEWLGQLFQRA